MQVQALIEPDLESGGFTATIPGFPGCVSDGETVADARKNVTEAFELWLEAMNGMALEELVPSQKKHVVSIEPTYLPIVEAA